MTVTMGTRKQMWFKWVVVAVGFYINTFVFATLFTFGSLLNAMLDKYRENISKTATVQAIFTGVGLISGVFTGLLISKLGMRTTSLAAGVLASLGFILSFFASSIEHLYICIGVIAGIGTSIIVIASTTAVGQAFTGSQKLLALSIQNTGMSVGGAVTPYLFDYLVESYGLNGNFLLIGGVFLNCLPAALLFSMPVTNRNKAANGELKLNPKGDTETKSKPPSQNYIAVIRKELKRFKTDVAQIMRPPFILTALAVAVVMASLNGYYALVIDILKWKGFTADDALLAFPVTYGVGFFARLLPGVAKQFKGVNSLVCPIIFALCGASGQLVNLYFHNSIVVLCGCGLSGIALAGVISGANIVVVKILDQDKIADGLGIVYSAVGILSIISGPTYGAMRDASNSYDAVIYSTFAFQLLGAILFTCAIVARKKESKEDPNNLKRQEGYKCLTQEKATQKAQTKHICNNLNVTCVNTYT